MDTELTQALSDLQRRIEQLEVEAVGRPRRLWLPNLHPTYIIPSHAPNMQVAVEIENNGDAPTTRACWVYLDLKVRGRNQFIQQQWHLWAVCPPLPAHQRTKVTFPLVQGVLEDASATGCVTVDFPTRQHPGGLIRESREDDNYLCALWSTSLADPRESPPEHGGYNIDDFPPEDPDWGKNPL